MKVYQSPDYPKLNRPVVSVGFFDGVHTGHQRLLRELIAIAGKNESDHLVITMWPHPSIITGATQEGGFLLNTLEEKTKLLERVGIRHVFVLDFNQETMKLSAGDFLQTIIAGKFNASAILMGFNNSFGYGASSYSDIYKTVKNLGISIFQAEEYQSEQQQVSSTAIRNNLQSGRVDKASLLLGYPYSIDGIVISGYKIGRTLGYKTANIRPCFNDKILPGNGVYAVTITYNNETFRGMMNIGVRPSFQGKELSLEAHIFDFDQDIYGAVVSIEFHTKLRDEIKFDEIENLKKQIDKDKAACIRFFARKGKDKGEYFSAV
ncbi:MAG TPA: bifunctional riboflavin kinase/FAD synthetase [Bacteroidales bacterium]|nr:bifunctional riboflavin kinase/FAD synthetase [Bacteroidales bacterium]